MNTTEGMKYRHQLWLWSFPLCREGEGEILVYSYRISSGIRGWSHWTAQLEAVKMTYQDFTIIKTRNKISQNLNLGREDGSASKGVWWLHLVPQTNVKGQNVDSTKLSWPPQVSKPQCLSPFFPIPHTQHNTTQNLRWQSITLAPERQKGGKSSKPT